MGLVGGQVGDGQVDVGLVKTDMRWRGRYGQQIGDGQADFLVST